MDMTLAERDWLFLHKIENPNKINYDGGLCFRVLDTEVSVRDPEDYSAFVPENRLHAVGLSKGSDAPFVAIHRWDDVTETKLPLPIKSIKLTRTIMVGHNIKYDIHWLMRVKAINKKGFVTEDLHKGEYTIQDIPLVWDTQLVEYLLTGQQVRMASLDDLCRYYKLPTKPDEVKELWKAGVLTKDIDPTILDPYLTHDLKSTAAIFEKQVAQVAERGPAFQFLVQSQLNMLRTVILMEWNGLTLDTKKCLDGIAAIDKEVIAVKEEIKDFTNKIKTIPKEAQDQINYTSNATVAAFVYGENDIPYVVKVPDGSFKNGKPKFKKRTESFRVAPPSWEVGTVLPAAGDSGIRSVSEDSLKYLLSRIPAGFGYRDWYIRLILKHRELQKLSGTISKLPEFIKNPANSQIHHNLNQTVTATGRLSSSRPNMQNRSELVQAMFKSRRENGKIISIDFSQIEILALAEECQDFQLLDDLEKGIDVHWVTGCEVYKEWSRLGPDKITHEARRNVKVVNFGIIYGGSNKAVSEQTGVPKETVALIRKALYNRYPGIKDWQERNISYVEKNAKVLPGRNHSGYPAHFSVLKSKTGRVYYFEDTLSPAWVKARWPEKDTSFSPTQIKNFPIQGLATADWVPMLISDWLGTLNGFDHNVVMPINTTHDDLEMDVVSTLDIDKVQKHWDKYLKEEFPKLWRAWTGRLPSVKLQVKVKVVHDNAAPPKVIEVKKDNDDKTNIGDSIEVFGEEDIEEAA